MSYSPYKELVQSLFQTTREVDAVLAELQKIATKINTKYDPRAQFIRWRDSQEGQLWKQKQYQAQGKCCAICNKLVQLKGSHIDHKQPLSLYPHLALDTRNLQITCPECNTSKSNKISDFTN
ncbi:MAG: HNH endonuclease [Coleofasciculus sp. Co-bin14]|nr:HNH endonuclease [Coleofasciculus sp. Co-bin14]